MLMKSYWIQTQGQGMHLDMREVEVPQPQAGQLRVRLHAAAGHAADLHAEAPRARVHLSDTWQHAVELGEDRRDGVDVGVAADERGETQFEIGRAHV